MEGEAPIKAGYFLVLINTKASEESQAEHEALNDLLPADSNMVRLPSIHEATESVMKQNKGYDRNPDKSAIAKQVKVFETLKTARVNGINQRAESLVARQFGNISLSHIPQIYEDETKLDDHLTIQNTTVFRTMLLKLGKLNQQNLSKTILYLGEHPKQLDLLFQILDSTKETHNNAVFMKTVIKEAEQLHS